MQDYSVPDPVNFLGSGFADPIFINPDPDPDPSDPIRPNPDPEPTYICFRCLRHLKSKINKLF